jgi:hypothetical protein
MTLNKGSVVEGVLGGLITAGILGVFVWGSQGGLVHVLGGITSKEVEDLVKKRLPNGIIVGFDLPDGCPVGWVVVYKDIFDPSYPCGRSRPAPRHLASLVAAGAFAG